MDGTRGRLLVALPALRDPNFDRTVLLMLQHDDQGALGVILNRPSGLDLVGNLAAWERVAAPPAEVFWGGPVAKGVAIGLGRSTADGPTDGWAPLFADLGTVELGRPPEDVAVDVRHVRVFVGYSGWGSGQLEGEIEMGAWLVVEADPGDAVSDEPLDLWAAVLRRQGGTTAWLARFPDDPSLN
jgi:putative transcriptional regulator